MFRKTRKIDLSALHYLTDEDLTEKVITLDEIKKDYPHTKKSELEAYKLLYLLNFKNLSDDERINLEKIINILAEREANEFKNAINYIECQNQQE
ncbi:MAG: hypothetical protein RLZZ354_621 [Pseudomonadota bacterium]|jgi:hypothetical protein